MDAMGMLKQTRALVARAVEGLSGDQWTMIPEGHRNNILWNVGHLIVVQQMLTNGLSGLPLGVSDELVAKLKRGTSPADWDTPPNLDELLSHLESLPEAFERDYRENRFTGFQPYSTSTGVSLRTIDDAVTFNEFHEGFHAGVILSMKKLVRRD